MMKEAYPIKDSPSGLEQYAGSPIRVVDGKAEAARWLVDGKHVFDENEKKTAIRIFVTENEKEPAIKKLATADISKAEGIRYATADEALLHLNANVKPDTERIKDIETIIAKLEAVAKSEAKEP